uniref:Uncharacterized protein n=1 Tax=Populus trichocarpa TaxID=3694 RepID=U7E2X8_POPTR
MDTNSPASTIWNPSKITITFIYLWRTSVRLKHLMSLPLYFFFNYDFLFNNFFLLPIVMLKISRKHIPNPPSFECCIELM